MCKKKFFRRLIVGGQDGSVTVLIICETGEENRNKTVKLLRSLPSRQFGGSVSVSASEDEELKLRAQVAVDEKRKRLLRRFRWAKVSDSIGATVVKKYILKQISHFSILVLEKG